MNASGNNEKMALNRINSNKDSPFNTNECSMILHFPAVFFLFLRVY